MDIQILPRRLSGPVTPPPSKSMTHRLLLCAALSGGSSTLRNIAFSEDVEATLRCVAVLGAGVEQLAPSTLRIRGIGHAIPQAAPEQLPRFDCGESGSTLRFLIPIALAVTGGGIFTGRGRLLERPLQPYFDLFAEKGISYTLQNNTLTVRGRLSPGEYRLPGNVSSQFFTGLLLALPLLNGPSTIISTTALESSAYIAMTGDAMEQAGVRTAFDPAARAFTVFPAAYRPVDAAVEADWSQAAFWYAALALGNAPELSGLNAFSAQGDMVIVPHYLRLTRPGDAEIHVSGCPDLLPPLAVMAAVRSGTTRFVGAARLRLKESDRLTALHRMLTALGAQAEEGTDSLTVHGVPALQGGTVDGANDHRIVMAAAVAATACRTPVTIRGAEAVSKSYPDFFEVYRSLGGACHVL